MRCGEPPPGKLKSKLWYDSRMQLYSWIKVNEPGMCAEQTQKVMHMLNARRHHMTSLRRHSRKNKSVGAESLPRAGHKGVLGNS